MCLGACAVGLRRGRGGGANGGKDSDIGKANGYLFWANPGRRGIFSSEFLFRAWAPGRKESFDD
jgi:hypothetical protein